MLVELEIFPNLGVKIKKSMKPPPRVAFHPPQKKPEKKHNISDVSLGLPRQHKGSTVERSIQMNLRWLLATPNFEDTGIYPLSHGTYVVVFCFNLFRPTPSSSSHTVREDRCERTPKHLLKHLQTQGMTGGFWKTRAINTSKIKKNDFSFLVINPLNNLMFINTYNMNSSMEKLYEMEKNLQRSGCQMLRYPSGLGSGIHHEIHPF